MIAELMKLSLRHRWIVLGAAAAMIAFCLYAATQLPIDAYPDISPQKVSVVTAYPGCAPEEVERQVTIPIEIAMRNIPKVETVRSQTIFGLSVVDLIFEEGTETYWARQQVNEKLSGIELPDGAEMPELGPATSSCGEIYRYELVSDVGTDVMELRTLNEWVVIPRLLRVPGVADVSNFGGLAKQYVIRFDPIELQRFHLTLADVTAAVASNSSASGGSLLNRGGMALV
ncbi:MAG: efflux RND transporter permease subunit, partial [Thermoguttaceae bacterium]|nr:efflux RND transporter permease subunit [Thermoguttaceae bacterium]